MIPTYLAYNNSFALRICPAKFKVLPRKANISTSPSPFSSPTSSPLDPRLHSMETVNLSTSIMEQEMSTSRDEVNPRRSGRRRLDVTAKTCPICGRVFSKAEHMLRHERSHSQTRPYRCLSCSKNFTRKYVIKDEPMIVAEGLLSLD